jgi:hypothetical protein
MKMRDGWFLNDLTQNANGQGIMQRKIEQCMVDPLLLEERKNG